MLTTWNGRPYPLGATYDGEGTNFALFTEVAERVDLVLVGPRRRRPAGPRNPGGRGGLGPQ
ncbi:hypothetical protein, partial [Streptomyces sp. NPDC059759]|uniref:hypothetical protein n=1 Tax=Streptomyces sp. NPDC059759 TaxID=3346936 RepID=UPI003653EE8C